MPRLRIGISQASPGEATSHVLSEFAPRNVRRSTIWSSGRRRGAGLGNQWRSRGDEPLQQNLNNAAAPASCRPRPPAGIQAPGRRAARTGRRGSRRTCCRRSRPPARTRWRRCTPPSAGRCCCVAGRPRRPAPTPTSCAPGPTIPSRCVLFPETDALPYDRLPNDPDKLAERLGTLSAWPVPRRRRRRWSWPRCARPWTWCSIRKRFDDNHRVIKRGQVLPPAELAAQWLGLGYEPSALVDSPGLFSRRGGILDVFPPGGQPLPSSCGATRSTPSACSTRPRSARPSSSKRPRLGPPTKFCLGH